MRIQALSPEPAVICRSPNPKEVYTYSPALCVLPDGSLLATLDFGVKPGCERLLTQGRGQVMRSFDGGESWTPSGNFPFIHARPFLGWENRLYSRTHGRSVR